VYDILSFPKGPIELSTRDYVKRTTLNNHLFTINFKNLSSLMNFRHKIFIVCRASCYSSVRDQDPTSKQSLRSWQQE